VAQLAIARIDNSRMRLLVWPREHGAWGIIGISLLTGTAVGLTHESQAAALLWFGVAVVALFCARNPLEILLGTAALQARTDAERRRVRLAFLAFVSAALLALAGLLWRGQHSGLLVLGALCGLLFLLQSQLRRRGRQGRMAAQVVGALGLTASAAGAYYVATGQLKATMIALWMVNWIFAGNQIHFVQLRIRGACLENRRQKFSAGRAFFAGQFIMMLALGAATWRGVLPEAAVAAFVPVLVRGLVWFLRRPQPLSVQRLGLTELAHAVIFGVLLIASYRI
jgi:hypothetical protein